ncbi:MAG: inorganic pyrophosphatase [Gammaproteobacteria bacterium]|nr:inorganic pyrophosphatase [Gammaproteobacteria bacterium]
MDSDKSFHSWRPHPWHGLVVGKGAPKIVTAYIEMTPFDLVKYETDKHSGYIRVDRPQRASVHPPTLYGFVPQTLCADRVGALSNTGLPGDHDPLDICVISERPINRANIIMDVRVLGGLRMIDHGEVDDKIVAVLQKDNQWGGIDDISGLPPILVERLVHYFRTYKWIPGETSGVSIDEPYGREEAEAVILAAMADYQDVYGDQMDSDRT